MIDFYGAPASSAGRTHLVLEECGVPYTYHRVKLRDPAEKADYLKINPSGRVPFIVDGDVRLQESIAINFYLVEKYAPELWATDLAQRAQIYAWSMWSITNLQPEGMRFARHTFLIPAESRSTYEAETGKANTQKLVDELERVLGTSEYLVGGKLSVADYNVASVVNLVAGFKIAALGAHTQAWLDRMKARPAWQKAAKEG
jgi:glutathione S-transferase